MHGPAHEVLLLIAYAQMPLLNAHADNSSEARSLNFGLSLRLQLYFIYASSEGSGELSGRISCTGAQIYTCISKNKGDNHIISFSVR